MIIVLALLWSWPAPGGETPVPEQAVATVAEVPTGDTIVLEQPIGGSRIVRLSGMEARSRNRDRDGLADPWAEQAMEALAQLTAGRELRLDVDGIDRYGRLRAQAHREDGLWIQGEMIARGFGRVQTRAGEGAYAQELLALEREARRAQRGIWSDPYFRVRDPQEVVEDDDSFQIVQGRVLQTARVRDRVYLNFGADWRTDFTVSIHAGKLASFEDFGLDPLDLAGRRIRVRGWIEMFNGPMIDVTHPQQIEVLPEPAAGRSDADG